MLHFRRTAALLVLPLVLAARPVAAQASHAIDKAHSEINFVADSRLLSAHGFFGKWDAVIQLDPTKLEASTVAITIDASTINTRVEMRDNHLRSDDFFAVAKHPTITFTSASVKQTAPNKLDITGDLTVRGVTRRIVVPASMVFYDKGAGRFRGAVRDHAERLRRGVRLGREPDRERSAGAVGLLDQGAGAGEMSAAAAIRAAASASSAAGRTNDTRK